MDIKKIGILYHPKVKAAYKLSHELEKPLADRGISTWICSAWEPEKAKAILDNTDLILTSGGDGTILRAVQVALSTQTPITGINLGKLGFMTELSASNVLEELNTLLDKKSWIDERSMLEAEIISSDKLKEPSPKLYALNDIVVARGAIARLINIETSIDGGLLTTYRADGVIVATATGSTGYSLAAGGPIIHPKAKESLLVPIMPHLGLINSLILPSSAVISLRIITTHEATLIVDGHISFHLSDGDIITIRHSSRITRFLRIKPETSYYSSLEQKLKGRKQIEPGRKS